MMLRRTVSDVGKPNGTTTISKPAPTLGGFARTLMSRASTGKANKDEDSECDLSPNSIRQLLYFDTKAKMLNQNDSVKENLSPQLVEAEKPEVSPDMPEAGQVHVLRSVHSASDLMPRKYALITSGQVAPTHVEMSNDSLRRPVRMDAMVNVERRDDSVLRDPVRKADVQLSNGGVAMQKFANSIRSSSEQEIPQKLLCEPTLAASVSASSVRDALDLSSGVVGARKALAPVKECTESPKNIYIPEVKNTPRGYDLLKTAKSESSINYHPNHGVNNEGKIAKKSPPLVVPGEPDVRLKCAVRISGNPTPRRSANAPVTSAATPGLPPRPTHTIAPSISHRTPHHFSLPSRRGRVPGVDLEALKRIGDNSMDNGVKPQPQLASKSLAEEWNIEVERVQSKKYQIIRQLGQGGSGKVYLVVEKETRNLFALKKVNLEGVQASILDECVNEVKMLIGLKDSDFVVRIDAWEINKAQNMMKIVMEYGSCDLAVSLRTAKPDLLEVRSMWKRMLKIVAELHQRGIVHSDLKPSNFVWVCNRLKIIDFGIASRIQTDITSIDILNPKGTVNYISPETIAPNAMGKAKVGPKSDIWALGCILYLMVYGKTPFQDHDHIMAKISAISQGKIIYPPLPQEFASSGVDSVLRLCFAMDPHKRPSALELLRHPFVISP